MSGRTAIAGAALCGAAVGFYAGVKAGAQAAQRRHQAAMRQLEQGSEFEQRLAGLREGDNE